MAPDSRPPELLDVKTRALRAISPIVAAHDSTEAEDNILFNSGRTAASDKLPAPHLIYFLLVELLGFRNLGRFEKLAWSVPVDFEGRAFLVEHRKFGAGIFVPDPEKHEAAAERIAQLLQKGVRAAKPFFAKLAEDAVRESKFNVVNNARSLFERFQYFTDSYKTKSAEAKARKDEVQIERFEREGSSGAIYNFPARELSRKANWLAMAAIDSFFGWTEHILVHLAILRGTVTNGEDVANLIGADWQEKYKAAIGIEPPEAKHHFDVLVTIRRQLRNFFTHGAFGKQGEAFHFHSAAGAVPVVLDDSAGGRFSLTPDLAFDDGEALAAIEEFIAFLWADERAPAQIYIQEAELPLILTMASDGTYTKAMVSTEEMNKFALYLSQRFDDATNMDW